MKLSPAYFLLVALLAVPATSASSQVPRPTPEDAAKPTPATQGESDQAKPLLSPAATVDVRLDGKQIVVDYGSPSMRGRKVMGGLVPYGQVWRTGANPATSFTTESDLMVGKLHVPAGKYTLYTRPERHGCSSSASRQDSGERSTTRSRTSDEHRCSRGRCLSRRSP